MSAPVLLLLMQEPECLMPSRAPHHSVLFLLVGCSLLCSFRFCDGFPVFLSFFKGFHGFLDC